MIGTTALEGMGEDDVLALATERAETIRTAEADLFRIAYQWAVINSPDRITSGDRPGGEKARLHGGDGTPHVSEFAAAELGARIGRTTFAAGQLMADALRNQAHGMGSFLIHGPIPVIDQIAAAHAGWVRDVLGPTCRFKIQPVLDLAGQAPVDAYEIPDRHRQAVHLMTPADTFPYGSSLSRKQQVDHTIPYDHGGPSGLGMG